MDFFHLFDDEDKRVVPLSPKVVRRLNMRTPPSSPSRLKVPDLVEDSDSSSNEGRDESMKANERQPFCTIEMKLQKARERREEIDRIREITLNDKNKQALQRAKENIECKRERLREKTSRVAKVKARHSMIKERNRKEALASIENKLNGAMTRAEENIRKKQIKARNRKRAERAEKKRKILEFERRSLLLSSVDRRTELAQKHVELLMKDRQCKAREYIEHAQQVSRRVRAARVLQRAVRALTWSATEEPQQKDLDRAAIKLQCWLPWKANVTCRRLLFADEGCPTTPLESLRLILSRMGSFLPQNKRSSLSFEDLTSEMGKNDILVAAKALIGSFGPMMGDLASTERTFLSVFLIAQQPVVVLGTKRNSDGCSRLLESASHKLIKSLIDLTSALRLEENKKQCIALVTHTASCLLSYCTLFAKWKRADVDELVEDMAKSACRSWIAFLTAKEAIAYAEVRTREAGKEHGDPLYQHKVRFKSTRRGANSHLKRIRASIEKLLGPKEGLAVLKRAKQLAVTRMEEDDLAQKAKCEIDTVCEAHTEKIKSETKEAQIDINDAAALDDVNEHVVHEILLADNVDIKERLCKNPDASIVDCLNSFMDKFKNSTSLSENADTIDSFTFTMEKAFADHMIENWISNNNMVGVKEMLSEIMQKMRNLVPKRVDLHVLFSDTYANACEDAADVLALLARVANAMSSSLESEYRATSTLQWLKATRSFGSTHTIPFQFPNIHSYVVFSMLFLVKKLDICHADLVNFKLMRVTPLIRQNGVSYERQCFLQKHPTFDELHGTRNWVKRMNLALEAAPSNIHVALKEGFVDELLFVRERISMPEVLSLDAARISSIRDRTQRAVICSSLFLHASNIAQCRVSSLQSEPKLSKAKYHKDVIMKSLRNNLPYDELYRTISVAVVSLTEAICEVELENATIESLLSATDSVLKGSDPVLSLMDKRIRDLFKAACTFELSKVNAPQSMRSGIQSSKSLAPGEAQKNMFSEELRVKSMKLGFGVVAEDIVEASYDAFKIIDHCIKVHDEYVFMPIMNELKEKQHEE